MKKPGPLDYKLLRHPFDFRQFDFSTTAELKTSSKYFGQDRAVEAINFGIGIKSEGYNLFAMGPSGIGKRSIIRVLLKAYARTCSSPSDWCYIYNFKVPERPISLELPAGLGSTLQQDMKLLIDDLKINLLSVYESDEYRLGMQAILEDFNQIRKKMPEENIGDPKKDRIPHLYRERHEKEKAFQLRFNSAVVKPFIRVLKKKYQPFPKLLSYLTSLEKDILAHVNDFIKIDETSGITHFDLENPLLTRYEINLLVNNRKRQGVPVIFEENPSYSNLICRVEYKPQLGTLVTDFTLIRSGALHRANGGFLIMEARKLKKNKDAWEGLKSALISKKIKIVPLEHLTESVHPISLKPKSIPLNIKVILLGARNTYYNLSKTDPDFSELFKVAVDFDEQITRNEKNIKLYASLIATLVKRSKLLPFTAGAVGAIIDYSVRLTEDVEKLSTHILRIDDLIQEAHYWASVLKKEVVDDQDVKRAIAHQIHRMDRTREIYYEDILRNFILINTTGEAIGQVNCLSVVKVGKFSYGHPTKVTAKVRPGKGKIIDIQREVKLAGPIHSKAGLILANFLADRYSKTHIFSLTASLAFEQIYGMLEGDSASVAELCALLSALAEVPINQSFAITGSINQYGEVQAIGGVNEKIEGYFDICKARELTGKQGVLIPSINVKNLMLREDIVECAKLNKFNIYPINTLDEAIFLLTNVPAGGRNKRGFYPVNSINYKVEKKLYAFAKSRFKDEKKYTDKPK